jgi:peptidoglycan/LPS O-acetylase OafA/YrhL
MAMVALAVAAFVIPVVVRASLDAPIAKPLLYFGDFLIGVVAARVYDRLHGRAAWVATLGPWLAGGAAVGGLLLLVYRDTLGSFLVFDAGVRLVSASLVFGLAWGGGGVARLLSGPLLMAGGRASYAIYILHVPVLWWWQRSTPHAVLPPVVAGLAYVILVVWLAVVVCREYEYPANEIVRTWFARRFPRRTAAADVVPQAMSAPVDPRSAPAARRIGWFL